MKNLLLLIFITIAFAACKSKSEPDDQARNIRLLTDTTIYNNNASSDTVKEMKTETVQVKPSVHGRTTVQTKKATPTVAKKVSAAPVHDQVITAPASTTPPVVTAPESTSNSGVDKTIGEGKSETASASEGTKVHQKKGLNKAAQGAIIGGVTGAVGGAIISKKKGVGAVVGGIVGAAGGYIIGKKMDKKDKQSDWE